MTERELKKYALVGLLVRINAEEKKYNNTKDPERKKFIKSYLDTMKVDYNNLLNELQEIK